MLVHPEKTVAGNVHGHRDRLIQLRLAIRVCGVAPPGPRPCIDFSQGALAGEVDDRRSARIGDIDGWVLMAKAAELVKVLLGDAILDVGPVQR